MPSSDTFVGNKNTVRKPHTNTAVQSNVARFVRCHLNTQYTVHYTRSQGKNSRSLGFSSCVCLFQLPPRCFPSCSRCPVVSSPLSFSFLPSGLSFSLTSFYWSDTHLTPTSCYPTLGTNLSFLFAAFSKDVTWWVTDSSCAEDCVWQLQLLFWYP